MSSLAAIPGIAGNVAGAAFDIFGQWQKDQAAKEALKQQQAQIAREQARLGEAKRSQLADLAGSFASAEEKLNVYGNRAQQQLGSGYSRAQEAIGRGYGEAAGAASRETGQGISDLQRLERILGREGTEALIRAREDVMGGLRGAESTLTPAIGLQDLATEAAMGTAPVTATSAIPGMLGGELSREQAYAGFESDPGYQYRLRESERAINRAAAAHGGRTSGATLKALQDRAGEIASEEFDKFANRQNQLNQLRANLAQSEAGRQLQLAGMGQTADLNQRARQMQLAQAGLQAGSQLAQLRAGTGEQLAGQGLNMYGQQAGLRTGLAERAAGMRQGLGAELANLSTGEASQLANLLGQRAQLGANLSQTQGSQLASLLQNLGSARADVTGATAARQAQLGQALLPAFTAPVTTAAGPWEAAGSGLAQLGGGLSLMGNMAAEESRREAEAKARAAAAGPTTRILPNYPAG